MSGYRYFYRNGEANFAAPVQEEMAGGAHLTFDVILHQGPTLYALRRPQGLHDGPKGALYFPHGLICFGESVDECAERLAQEQAGVGVRRTRLYTMPTWVENNHWHLCLNVLAEVDRRPVPFGDVSEVVEVGSSAIPGDFAWWTPEQATSLTAFVARAVGEM
jgi:8-oxo-dGTP pyrophosphatase MutT (NUDIX family)